MLQKLPPAEGKPVIIELAGAPVGKGRPRFVRATGRTYTPSKTARYEDQLRIVAGEAMGTRVPIEGPLQLVLTAWLPVPTSWSRKKREEALIGLVLPTTRPDLDNYMKAALDACNGIVFRDDSQVTDSTVRKRYSDRPRLVIELNPIGDER